MSLTLHVHVARVLHGDVARKSDCHRRPSNVSSLGTKKSSVLLLCLTGALDRSYMQRWTRDLDSRYGSFWKDQVVYDNKAWCLLILGYLSLCAPCSLALGLMVLRSPMLLAAAFSWQWLLSILIFSLFLLLLYWYALLSHSCFSHVENQFAFNVNTQMASFFKQYRAYPMKPYAAIVPRVTITRLFIESHKITFTTLSYHVSSNANLLIPTACEAIDTLRAKKNAKIFINLIVVASLHPEQASSMHALLAFFTASGFHALLAPDASLLACMWGRAFKTPIHTRDSTAASDAQLSLVFTVPHASAEPELELAAAPQTHRNANSMSPLLEPPPPCFYHHLHHGHRYSMPRRSKQHRKAHLLQRAAAHCWEFFNRHFWHDTSRQYYYYYYHPFDNQQQANFAFANC